MNIFNNHFDTSLNREHKEKLWPIASYDTRDHFGSMTAATSLTIVSTRSLESLHNAIIDSDFAGPAKTVAKVALGVFTATSLTFLSLLETISRLSIAIIVGFGTLLFSLAELMLKVSIHAALYLPLGICKTVDYLLSFGVYQGVGFLLSKLGVKDSLQQFFEDAGITHAVWKMGSAISYIGEEVEIFEPALVDHSIFALADFLGKSFLINAASIPIGISMGSRMITSHQTFDFREFVWHDSYDSAFSCYNIAFD